MLLAIIPVALAIGIGILALGTWLGGKLMDARMLSIVATLDSFASLLKAFAASAARRASKGIASPEKRESRGRAGTVENDKKPRRPAVG